MREQICDSLREAIIIGAVRPGERLSEMNLARRFGASRTPVREAFNQLCSEGFVHLIPHRGAAVTTVTDKDVREFYEIKSILEGLAARKACPRLTDRDIKKMEDFNDQMESSHREGNWKSVFKLHNEFHEVFLRLCGNDRLYNLIHRLVEQFQFFRIALALTGKMEGSIAQHREIVSAFRDKDANRVDDLVRQNAVYGGEILVKEVFRG